MYFNFNLSYSNDPEKKMMYYAWFVNAGTKCSFLLLVVALVTFSSHYREEFVVECINILFQRQNCVAVIISESIHRILSIWLNEPKEDWKYSL